MWFEQAVQEYLEAQRRSGRSRTLRAVVQTGPPMVFADGRQRIDFASNDYLGLASHPALIARAREWTARFGAGARASRLIGASLEAMLETEARLAAFKGCPAALVFCSGWQANASVLPALFALAGGRRAQVFSDRLNHASMHAGCSTVHQIRYRHRDTEHLAQLLAARDKQTPCFILSETVFSMDGDCADVAQLARLAREHQALLYLDDAHATGVLGPQGRGLASAALAQHPDTVVMGTLGKALGGAGAYIAGSRTLMDYLIHSCSGFIHTTAPPPAVFGALDAALDLVPAMEAERIRLAQCAQQLRSNLANAGLATYTSSTQIVPVAMGSEARALAAQDYLDAAGFYVPAIRPPTVAQNACRLRVSLSAKHSDTALADLADTFVRWAQDAGKIT